MKFYYTGALEFNSVQNIPTDSLGGLFSSTLVPNALLQNVFGEVSLYSLEKLLRSTYGLALKNESVQKAINVKLWFEYPVDPICKIKIAVVAPTFDSIKNTYCIEKIANSQALPYYATFYEADGILNQLALPDILAGKYLGIWLSREFLTPEPVTNTVLCETETSAILKEEILLKMTWDLE